MGFRVFVGRNGGALFVWIRQDGGVCVMRLIWPFSKSGEKAPISGIKLEATTFLFGLRNRNEQWTIKQLALLSSRSVLGSLSMPLQPSELWFHLL